MRKKYRKECKEFLMEEGITATVFHKQHNTCNKYILVNGYATKQYFADDHSCKDNQY